MRLVSAVVALLCIGGCGGGSGASAGTGTSRMPAAAPPTEWDPPAWTPVAETGAASGRPVGVPVSGGYDQARGVALELIRALRDGDGQTLEQLLDDPLAVALPRLGAGHHSRARIIHAAAAKMSQAAANADTALDQLVDVQGVDVTPVAQLFRDRPIPSGMQGSDLRVTFPLRPRGQQMLGFLPGWNTRGSIVVRPGAQPTVVAM